MVVLFTATWFLDGYGHPPLRHNLLLDQISSTVAFLSTIAITLVMDNFATGFAPLRHSILHFCRSVHSPCAKCSCYNNEVYNRPYIYTNLAWPLTMAMDLDEIWVGLPLMLAASPVRLVALGTFSCTIPTCMVGKHLARQYHHKYTWRYKCEEEGARLTTRLQRP